MTLIRSACHSTILKLLLDANNIISPFHFAGVLVSYAYSGADLNIYDDCELINFQFVSCVYLIDPAQSSIIQASSFMAVWKHTMFFCVLSMP
jgi:hypothetical protein